MLTQVQAQKFAIEHQTTVDNILKEHFQMVLLDALFNSSLGDKLVFKGGTALRLAYHSARLSEDLDFSLSEEVSFAGFQKVVRQSLKLIPGSTIKDIHDKHYTLYAKVMVNVSYQPIPIDIKIEVNKNNQDFEQSLALIKSPFNNLEVIGRVYTLQSILADKLRILENGERREPRDLFDAWYISQKMDTPFIVKENWKYDRKTLMDSLFHFLPQNQKKIVELFQK